MRVVHTEEEHPLFTRQTRKGHVRFPRGAKYTHHCLGAGFKPDPAEHRRQSGLGLQESESHANAVPWPGAEWNERERLDFVLVLRQKSVVCRGKLTQGQLFDTSG